MAKVADIDLELFESGKGSPVLFLHGGEGFDERQPFVAPLAAKHRLIAPSHPGFGKSSLPEWLDNVDIIGCSIGGWIAAEMATKTPERVNRLVMVGPVGVKVGSQDKLDIPDI